MDKLSDMKSKLMLFIMKPIQSMEEKFEKDLNKLEDLKNLFYELDKTSRFIVKTVTEITTVNSDTPVKIKNEKKFQKFNSSKLIETVKKRENNFNKSIDVKDETLKNNKQKDTSPVKKKEKPQITNASVDDKTIKPLKKEKALYESRRELTRNNHSKVNPSVDGGNHKDKNTALNYSINNNGINNDDKDFMEKVKYTHRNNDVKGGLKKEGIEKLKKDLEKKGSKMNLNERSKRALNLSADNFDATLVEKFKKKEKIKDKLLPPIDKKELSTDRYIIKSGKVNGTDKSNLNRTSDNIIISPFQNVTPKIKKIIIPKSKGVLSYINFDNSGLKCLAIFCCSSFFSVKERVNLVIYNKNFTLPDTKSVIFKEIIHEYEKKIKKIEEQLSPYTEQDGFGELLNKSFVPSKTSQNGLNFVKTLDESELAKKEQPEEILMLLRLIYLLTGEDYEGVSPQSRLLQNLIENIYPKLKVENLSKIMYKEETLFMNHIVKNTNNLTIKQVEKIVSFCESNPKIFNSSEILKMNKAMSFLCFIIKEIYDFVKQKTEDGTLFMSLRKLNALSNSYQEKLNILKKQI